MSSRKPSQLKQLTVSPKARQDITDILRYTAERWGESQLLTYRNKIHTALHAIHNNPQLGQQRDELTPAHYSYFVGSHIIVYRINENSIGIVRILHQRMSMGKHIRHH